MGIASLQEQIEKLECIIYTKSVNTFMLRLHLKRLMRFKAMFTSADQAKIFLLHAKSKLRAKKMDESAIYCNSRI